MDATEEMIRRSEEAARVAELTEQVQSHLPISAYLHFIYFYRLKSHNSTIQNWRETAQIQIREFNASRKKQLENLEKLLISETSSAPAPMTKEDQFSNIIELIDLQQDSNDGVDRSRMRQVLLKMKNLQ